MRRPDFIARQGRCPSGLLGIIIGRIMAHQTAAENAAAVDLLGLQPTDHVLEVGFGHGRTIRAIAGHVPNGFVAGVDASTAMFRLAKRANRNAIARGLVELQQGDSQSLPYADRQFDKVLTVHTIYFWRDLLLHFSQLRRILRQRGLLVLGFRPNDASTVADFPAEVYTFRSVAEICRLLTEAGFSTADVTESRSAGRPITFIRAQPSA